MHQLNLLPELLREVPDGPRMRKPKPKPHSDPISTTHRFDANSDADTNRHADIDRYTHAYLYPVPEADPLCLEGRRVLQESD